jgi:peptide/nickel transport system permease protein
MLAFAIRRAVWALPTLFGVSLVVFLLTTLLPDPGGEGEDATSELSLRMRAAELRRARFLDLPRFLNTAPRDVSTRVDEYITHLAAGDADAPFAAVRLAQMGGAALPWLLPKLDNLAPSERGRVALALAPVARRMGIGDERDVTSPERAALFWTRFWDDRSVDFTAPAVRRGVLRLVERGTELREQELVLVDTFALREVIGAMRRTRDRAALVRLTRVASHVTGQGRILASDATEEQAHAIVSEWSSWWFVHETDYVPLRGGEKVAASISQTRYAKWMLGAATGQLGLSTRDGLPILDKLLARAPITLGIALLGLLLGLCIAVPLGVIAAWQRGRTIDHVTGAAMVVLYALPTFLVAEVLRVRAGGQFLYETFFPVIALATVAVAATTQQQRAAMIEALGQDYVRVARAKGARTLRVAVVHALRNALVPTVTLAGLQFPALLGAAFVVEEVFDIHGMGWETLRAIEARDAAWIVGVTLLCALVTTFGLVASDVAYGVLDPRVRESSTGARRS